MNEFRFEIPHKNSFVYLSNSLKIERTNGNDRLENVVTVVSLVYVLAYLKLFKYLVFWSRNYVVVQFLANLHFARFENMPIFSPYELSKLGMCMYKFSI